MNLLESIVHRLREENTRLVAANEAYASGLADTGEGQGNNMISRKDEAIADNERVIASNQALIDRYEAGER